MTMTHKQLDAMMVAESRLISMGVLSPPDTSQDAEWAAAWTKASEESTRTGLPVALELPPRAAPSKR